MKSPSLQSVVVAEPHTITRVGQGCKEDSSFNMRKRRRIIIELSFPRSPCSRSLQTVRASSYLRSRADQRTPPVPYLASPMTYYPRSSTQEHELCPTLTALQLRCLKRCSKKNPELGRRANRTRLFSFGIAWKIPVSLLMTPGSRFGRNVRHVRAECTFVQRYKGTN
jgi:hypothetical protein